jgi:LysR family transcriptional regulator, hypochlorite-specific transcription factor HypT
MSKRGVRMDVKWLDDVLVLLEEGNMTRAAARRNITQPAFSRRIRSFEDWLGIEILERGTNRVEISAALISNEAEIRALVGRIRELRTKIAHFEPSSSTISIASQHAAVFSTFPDMALRAKHYFPAQKFRLRAGNLGDCVAMFLRGDASMLLCYESENAGPLPFGARIRRELWGKDFLIPVVGGPLRYSVKENGEVAETTPAVVYPDQSYFGEVLKANARPFGTPGFSRNSACETAFSSGIKELVLKGIGIGWLPYSMVYREIESGVLISLQSAFGMEPFKIAIYADATHEASLSILEIWKQSVR